MRWEPLRTTAEPAEPLPLDLPGAADAPAGQGTGRAGLHTPGPEPIPSGTDEALTVEIRAKSIINRVPAASHMPFSWTINPYRGCSHACRYCMAGDTAVLLADGHTKALADVRPGDVVYGTERRGNYRRYARTEVLAHWGTVKPAFRVELEDGTVLVASGDHRFLTTRGWKYVTGAGAGRDCRPHLTASDELVGVGSLREPCQTAVGTPATTAVQAGSAARVRAIPELGQWPAGDGGYSDADLRVVSVTSLGAELPMYDITTATGDFIANGVVSHNCFARRTHTYLDLDAGADFDTKIMVKVNAGDLLRRELANPRWAGESIAMGTNTDPYQRAEGRYRLMREIIAALRDRSNPFSILTKGTLILRDLDLIREAAERTRVSIAVSVGSVDEALWREVEPGTPAPARRLDVVRRFADAGIGCSVLMAPILPGLSDSPEQVERTVAAIAAAGADGVTPLLLHLRPGAREWYRAWLERRHPHLTPLYDRLYRGGSYAPRAYQRTVTAMVRDAARRYGLDRQPAASFRESGAESAVPAAEQLTFT
ncbi:MAG: Rv2578c family radical SAM protein [Streptosporangiales bacterium]